MAQDKFRRGRTAQENQNLVKQALAPHAYACPPRICVTPITPTTLATHPAQSIYSHTKATTHAHA
ncbi:hypothetical protein PIB30_113250, partial [Stylosanthes scabra]|nr:hypothetical protein [Stylosanthes scabra]